MGKQVVYADLSCVAVFRLAIVANCYYVVSEGQKAQGFAQKVVKDVRKNSKLHYLKFKGALVADLLRGCPLLLPACPGARF